MSTPHDPIARVALGVATGGLSEVPGQYKAVGDFAKGKDPFKSYAKGGSPMDVLTPSMPMSPQMPSVTAAPTTAPATSPAASIRTRRNFSTLLTGAQGDTSQADVSKNTLLGGNPKTLGR